MNQRSMWLLPVCFIIVKSLDPKQSAMFQNVIDTVSHLAKDSGISMGVAFPGEAVSFASGLKDRDRNETLNPKDRMGVGSGTKAMTAAAVLKLVETGKLGLDDPALPHMDVLLRKLTSKSVIDYLGPNMRNVTVRHLLSMTSGIGDFDSPHIRSYSFKHPTESELDIDQFLGEFMQSANEHSVKLGLKKDPTDCFTCAPGTCGEYSSTNYLLLGIVLAQAHGHQHWMQYDQASFMPPEVKQKMPSTIFPLQGQLRDFTDVHTYIPNIANMLNGSPLLKKKGKTYYVDGIDMAANGAFTVGNALSTGGDMAAYWQALLGKDSSILNPQTRAEMMKLRWLEQGLGNKVSAGQFYGIAVRDLSANMVENPIKLMYNPEIFISGMLYGHDGMSANGFNSISVYAPKYDFGLSFIQNDVKVAPYWNSFIKKLYDLASGMTQPVPNPLQATFENTENTNAFMHQNWVRSKSKKTVKT